jgi:hypothetical protein
MTAFTRGTSLALAALTLAALIGVAVGLPLAAGLLFGIATGGPGWSCCAF